MQFYKVEAPVFYPAACVCGSQDGPLADTLLENDHVGARVYLCHRCVRDAARLLGWTDPERVQELRDAIDVLAGENARLVAEVAELHANRVVPLADVRDLLNTLELPADVPAAQPSLTCSATRADGTPCTANALSGRDVCLAHSKVTA